MQSNEIGSKSSVEVISSERIMSTTDSGEVPNEAKDSNGKGEKRSKRRKTNDSSKKPRKDDVGEKKSRHSSATPDSEPRQDQLDSPIADDVFEGSNSSQESNDLLSMSTLLKSVLDQKKKLLIESDEIQQFLMERAMKQEQWDGASN